MLPWHMYVFRHPTIMNYVIWNYSNYSQCQQSKITSECVGINNNNNNIIIIIIMCLRRGFSLSLFGAIALLIWYFYCNCNTTLTRFRIMQSQKGKQPQKDNNKSSNYYVCIWFWGQKSNHARITVNWSSELDSLWGVSYQDGAWRPKQREFFHFRSISSG